MHSFRWSKPCSALISDPQTHLSFLTSLVDRLDTAKAKEAHVLLLASIAHAKLVYGDLEGTKNDMDAAGKVLDTLEGVEGSVNAAYYGVSADYYKVSRRAFIFKGMILISYRPKLNMHHITDIHYSISLVSIRRKT